MNEFGKDVRLLIKTGENAFTPVGGETSLKFDRSNQEQDLSDKDSGTYGASSYGQQKITFSLAGNVKLPDAGFSALIAASKAVPPQVEVKVVGLNNAVKYQGLVGVGGISADYSKDGPATYSGNMANAAAPTIDALDAVGA